MEPLALVPVIFRAAFLAEGLQDGGERGAALGSQVTPDHARAAERQPEPEVAVAEVEVVRGAGAAVLAG